MGQLLISIHRMHACNKNYGCVDHVAFFIIECKDFSMSKNLLGIVNKIKNFLEAECALCNMEVADLEDEGLAFGPLVYYSDCIAAFKWCAIDFSS